MPAAVVAVGASLAGAAATTAAISAGWVVAGSIGAAFVGAAATTIVGTILTDAAGLNEQAAAQTATGVQVNTESQSAPIPIVYGSTRIGGTLTVVGASGDNNEYIHIVVTHCEGDVQGATALYLGDTLHTDEKYNGLVHWEFFTGTDGQAACQTLLDANVGWTATDRQQGCAYSYIRLKYSSSVFSGIPQITAVVQGKKCYDPRNGQTAWTDNPVICLLDYLTNTRYGRRIPLSQIDIPSFIAAANVCNDTYTFTGNIAGVIQSIIHSLHTCNGAVSPDVSQLENTRAILSAFRGRLVFSAKGYTVLADTARAATFAFTPDNIVGSWQITLPGKRTFMNKVTGAWVNPDDLYKEDLYPAESLAFRAEDAGLLLEERISLPFTQVVHEAQILCERHLRQSRIGIQVSFKAFASAIACEVGDVVTITHPTPGWVSKPFSITGITLLNSSEVQVDCREYDDVVYSEHALTDPRTTYTTLLPDPNKTPEMTSQGVASGTANLQLMADGTIISRALVTWTPLTAIYLENGQVETQYRKVGDQSWTTHYSNMSTGWVYLSPVLDGATYEIKSRYINEIGIKGAWQTQYHTIIGKREPPSGVSGFLATPVEDRIVLSWDAVSDKDLSEYEIRDGTLWETAALVGKTKSTSIKVFAQFSGTKTWLIKAIDTSKNYSVSAAEASATITAAPATTIAAQVIDNTVLLQWVEVKGTLPTDTYDIRKGTDFATATKIGTKSGLFTSVIETQAGIYRYWVAPIDVAGNVGTPAYTDASVSQPPDYLLYDDFYSAYAGTKTNAIIDDGVLLLPINTTETWATHYTSRSWTTPQNQIDAGYPIYIQPALTTGAYVETMDYGQVLAGFKVSVSYLVTDVVTGCTVVCTLSTSTDGVSWSTPVTGKEAFFSNFRYLRVTLTVTNATDKGLVTIASLRIKLDTKRKTYGGKINCLAADTAGTEVFLTDDGTSTGTKLFADVLSLTPGSTGTTAKTAVFDFQDVPSPLSFKAFLFDTSGNRLDGVVYYTVIGI